MAHNSTETQGFIFKRYPQLHPNDYKLRIRINKKTEGLHISLYLHTVGTYATFSKIQIQTINSNKKYLGGGVSKGTTKQQKKPAPERYKYLSNRSLPNLYKKVESHVACQHSKRDRKRERKEYRNTILP